MTAASEKPRAKTTVLVVDDESVVRNLLKRYFTSIGYEVLLAESGEKALVLTEKTRPDLILLDITMPGLSGIKVLEKMLAKDPTLLVIMLTAVDDLQVARMSQESGAKDYLTKPIELGTLKKTLQTHLVFSR